MAELILKLKGQTLKRVPITKPVMSIGRDPSADVSIDNVGVSRSHCFVAVADMQFRVIDKGSHNGTFVNGERVDQQRALNDGDEIEIGKFAIQFSATTGSAVSDGFGKMNPTGPGQGAMGSTVALDDKQIASIIQKHIAASQGGMGATGEHSAMATGEVPATQVGAGTGSGAEEDWSDIGLVGGGSPAPASGHIPLPDLNAPPQASPGGTTPMQNVPAPSSTPVQTSAPTPAATPQDQTIKTLKMGLAVCFVLILLLFAMLLSR